MCRGTLKNKQLFVALALIVALLVPVGPASQAWSGRPSAELAAFNLEAPAQLPSVQPGSKEAALPEEISSVPGVSEDWWAAVQEQIQQDMYTLTSNEAGGDNPVYQGHNPDHGFVSTFTSGGVHLAPAGAPAGADEGAQWTWDLRFSGFGYEDGSRPVLPPAEMAADGNQIEYQRQGITEWYINDERGLEQGFVLHAPPSPAGAGEGGRGGEGLILEMALDTDLVPMLSDDAQTIDFRLAEGNVAVLRYSDLYVADATGRQLPAHLTLSPGGEGADQRSAGEGERIRIVIDDTGASYPLLVDPLVTTPDWTASGENDNNRFGSAVATAGDVNGDGYDDVIVGAFAYSAEKGKAYVYHGSAQGLSATAAWTQSSTHDHHRFGAAVGTAGDVNGDGYDDIIVGAPGIKGDNTTWNGNAYVYYGSADGLSAIDDWNDPGTNAKDHFGSSVGTAGDVNDDGYDDIIVGAPGEPNEGAAFGTLGKVYVYYGNANVPSTTAAWTVEGENIGDLFGSAVGTVGDVNGDGYDDVIVGAKYYEGHKGQAYVYHGGSGGLNPTPTWTATGENADDEFGCAVGSAGDVNGDGFADVVAGAFMYNGGTGKAYVYHGASSGLSASAAWTATGESAGDRFGHAVATAGDVNGDGYDDVIAGAYMYNVETGRAYVYHGSADGLSAIAIWAATGENDYDRFGWSVGMAGDVNGDGCADVLVGANQHDGQKGKAYVYHGSPHGLRVAYDWTGSGENASDEFGTAFAVAGDLNGDGYSDVVVGAPGNDGGGADAGKAYVYYGARSGLGLAPAWTAGGESPGDRFGAAVGAAGDLNGDGYDDLVVGAPRRNAGGKINAGTVYVYYGSAVGASPAADWTAVGESTNDEFGRAVAPAGDLNGDGYDDLVVGASGYPNSNAYGKVYVYHGAAGGLGTAPAWTATGQAAGDRFGWAVGPAGDVNGNGYADLVVGAPNRNNNKGMAYVYHGSALGLAAASAWSVAGPAAGDQFGYAVGTAGDVNGDGYSDVIVGAPFNDDAGADAGRADVYHGSVAGLPAMATWSVDGTYAGYRLGAAVGTAGDVNGDGYADVLVGAYGADSMTGQIGLYHGSSSGLVGVDWTAVGEGNGDRFGLAVGTAGDVNGDGYSDLIAGAPGYDAPGSANTGRATVYHGAADGPSHTDNWSRQPGTIVGTAGDVNGDGYSDVIVSDSFADQVWVYHGSSVGLSTTPAWTVTGESNLGLAVGTAGDVNGDGYADIIIGNNDNGIDAGRVYVYHGSPTGLSPGPADWSATGQAAGDNFGLAVGTAGDVNGDGYADVIVGAPDNDDNGTAAGKVYVYYGSVTGLKGAADWTATGENAGDRFGKAVSTAGDVNGDGYADVVGSAPYNDDNSTEAGKVYVYYGSVTGLKASADWTATGEDDYDYFGYAVSTAGDVNGDGYADVIIGTPCFGTFVGKVYIYHGMAQGLDAPFSSFTGEKSDDNFGEAVGTAGDVNGDGFSDIIVGVRGDDDSPSSLPKVHIYYGSTTGLTTGPADWTVSGQAAVNGLGHSVGAAGDVNGDGFADILVAGLDTAYLYQGNDGGGRLALARQTRGDGSDLAVQPWGPSYTRDSFDVSLQAVNPLGHGRARLQVQACPPGLPFGDPLCREYTADGWTTVSGAGGVGLSERVSGLEEGTLYRWRARSLYDSPLYPHGPWRRFLGQAQEADVRAGLLASDLQIYKTMKPSEELTLLAPITYTLTFTAAGGPAVGVVITDILPASLVDVRVVASGVTISDTGIHPGYVWSLGDLAAGQAGIITITGVAGATRFLNVATISGTSPDVDPGNNVASVQTHVEGILYVDADAQGANNGLSWANAFTDLQVALKAAASGDEIWVAEGIYKPTDGTDRAATFQLRYGVALYGGFAGNETYRHERDWLAQRTVLSGDIGTANNNADNAYHVVTGSNIDATTVLDGFTITGGNAPAYGGGMSVGSVAYPTIRNVRFCGNVAGEQGGGMSIGGAGSEPVLTNVVFSGNRAARGGGMAQRNSSHAVLINTTFFNNTATFAGGGIYNDSSFLWLTNSILWGNTATSGGGQIHDDGTVIVSYSDVQGGYPGELNIDADPQFMDADGPDDIAGTLDDDLRLHTTFRHPSPVIDRGDNSGLPLDVHDLDGDGDVAELLPLDASGRSRLIGFTVVAPTVDMGAYEANILDVLAEGNALLDEGQDFRLEHLQLLSADTLAQALQNYSNFNDGEWYYAFCADYGQIDADGYCPETGPDHVRNDLLDAVDLYRVAVVWPTPDWTTHDGQVIHVQELGGSSVLAATQEIANDHLIFGNEFLVDATDYRFSTTGMPYADQIIAQELDELAQARRQFELILGLVFRAFNVWQVGDYCSSDQFEQFGMASKLMMTALGEIAARHYMLGDSEAALGVYDQAYTDQYLHLVALAEMAAGMGDDYLVNGSWEMFNNLGQMRDRAEAIRDGLDFFGFAPEYAPLQAYNQLLELIEGPTGTSGLLGTARDLEDQARDAQRTFDGNASDMSTELDNLTVELNNQLFDLCGESEDDYETCEGGLMGQNGEALDAAWLRIGLAELRAQNIVEQIRIEEERADQVIVVHLGLGNDISAYELSIGALQAYRETSTQSSSTEHQLYAGVEVGAETYFQVETGSPSTYWDIPGAKYTLGFRASVRAAGGYRFSGTWINSTTKVWDPQAEAIADFQSRKALAQAFAQANIEGANSAAVVRNLLLQQSEALAEYEIAWAEFNKLAAEHNYLAERRSRLLNKRYQAVNRVASHNSHLLNPAYRIWRDSLTVQAAEAHGLAAQFAYLTARAAEYELLTAYPDQAQVFGARTSNDLRLFLDNLKVWIQALDLPGQLNRYPYTVSLAQDIWGLTDEALDPNGVLSPEERDQMRYERFQDQLQGSVYDDHLEFWFTTTLDQQRGENQYLFSPNIWNNRIAGIGAPLAQNEGVRLNIVTRQSGDAGNPEVVLIHGGPGGGAEAYRNAAGEIVYYDPDTAVPVGYLLPAQLDPENTTVVLRPAINGEGAIPNSGLINLSVAASTWILRIPAESRSDLDYGQIEDIEIYLDTTGRALPGWEAAAALDAVRLQAGQAMEPPAEERLRQMAAGQWSEQAGGGLAITRLEGRSLAPAIPGQIGGSYYGNIVITSPITLAVQLLNFDVVNIAGMLSGTVNVTETALYSGTIGLHGVADGEAFSLTSDEYFAVVAGRRVTQTFALAGHIVEGGDILKATYTGTIINLLPHPIVVQGMFSASRPGIPGSKRLLVEAESWSLPIHASLPITATLFDETMQVMTVTKRITFTTGVGTLLPAAVDTVDGIALVTFTAGDEPGEAVVLATTGEITGWVRIQIEANAWPVAEAGAGQEVEPGDTVTLDGSGSSDAEGQALTYSWLQTGGQGVNFTPNLSITTFIAPNSIGLLSFVLTVSDAVGLTDTDTVTISVAKTRIYLPVILRDPHPEPAPDLVVDTITVTSNSAQVVIRNQGDAPVLPATPFWVDLYIAPDPAPTGVNQPWDSLCAQGLVWGIPAGALPLDAGEAMTLTYSTTPGAPNVYLSAELSNFPGPLAEGAPVYAQVDSWHPDTAYGAVLEGHEMLGQAYNNIGGPVLSTAGSRSEGTEQTTTPLRGDGLPPSFDGLPPRP